MSRKAPTEVFQCKITRNDRFAQMSHQEKVIEQKKKEIQARLEQKQKGPTAVPSAEPKAPPATPTATVKSPKSVKKPGFNAFSNDGSFLDQYKQLKDRKPDQKSKSHKSKDSDFNDRNKSSRWSQTRGSQSPKEKKIKPRTTRFSDKSPYEPKINITSTYTNLLANQSNFENVTLNPPEAMQPMACAYQNPNPETVITAPPVLLNMPPPQIIQNIVVPSSNEIVGNIIAPMQSTVLTTVNLPVPNQAVIQETVTTTIELASIPPPNPIQVHNIPQPDPLNALTIPPPAPIQVQNIPPPSPIQLNEIPNPKPLDIVNIPTPSDNLEKISDPDFLKNIPPPNKSIPPPEIPSIPTCIPPPNIIPLTSIPPPPPPPPQPIIIQNPVPVGVPPPPPVSNGIPSLMARPVLPPPGMAPAPVNVSCPPPTFVSMPPMNVPPPQVPATAAGAAVIPGDMNAGTADYEAMAALARVVAQCGPGVEDVVRQRKTQDPGLWFLFHKGSAAYRQYRALVEALRREERNSYRPEDTYEQDALEEAAAPPSADRKRRRKSRWGDKDQLAGNLPPPGQVGFGSPNSLGNVMISKLTRNDPALVHYATTTFGSTNLTEEDWKKVEDHYKINVLYQEMMKKRQEVEKLKTTGRNKYEYDSDEEIDGGTWEHKLREKEMVATHQWATELTRQAEGKHHIGDFLPPDELKKFMEKSTAVKEGRQPSLSDYKEFALKEDNVGFKMLRKLGWSEGQGLGSDGAGIVEPINKGVARDQNQGLGLEQPDQVGDDDDEYESYRKRMMLAYRFRPNPLNNPRRPYY